MPGGIIQRSSSEVVYREAYVQKRRSVLSVKGSGMGKRDGRVGGGFSPFVQFEYTKSHVQYHAFEAKSRMRKKRKNSGYYFNCGITPTSQQQKTQINFINLLELPSDKLSHLT